MTVWLFSLKFREEILQGHPYDCFPQGLLDVYILVSMYPLRIYLRKLLSQLMGVTCKTYAPATDQDEEGWLLACSLHRNWNYNSSSIWNIHCISLKFIYKIRRIDNQNNKYNRLLCFRHEKVSHDPWMLDTTKQS